MQLTKEERLGIIAGERGRLAHGLYAAQVDVIVSKATASQNPQRLEAAEAELAAVEERIRVCDELAAQVEAEPA